MTRTEPCLVADAGLAGLALPDGDTGMRSLILQPAHLDGSVWGCLYCTSRAADAFSARDLDVLGSIVRLAVPVLALGHLARHERDQRMELERLLDGLATAPHGPQSDEPGTSAMLDQIAARGRALAHADAALVALTDGGVLRIGGVAGATPPSVLGECFRPDSRVLRALARRQPLRMDGGHPSWTLPAGVAGDGPIRGAVFVPLLVDRESAGMFVALNSTRTDDGAFTADDERELLAFGTTAGTVVATTRFVAAHGTKAAIDASERERQRWARELHDNILQQATALKLMLELHRDDAPEELQRVVGEAITRLGEQIDELRALLMDLRPASLERLGLAAGLENLVARTSAQTTATLSLDVAPEDAAAAGALPADAQVALFRIAQESLANAIAHSGAAHIRVVLRHADDTVTLRVEDDGAGFDPAAEAASTDVTRGFGLDGMRERVRVEHGMLTVTAAPGRGTTVEARLPCRLRDG